MTAQPSQIRTRIAPSPTGDMHVGSMAMVLKNYAYAKKHGGQFVLRIEDTDKTREVKDGVLQIQQIIKSYGLDWDEGPGKDGPYGPYIQSQRMEIYQKQVNQLIENGKAYYCFCSKERIERVRDQQRQQKKPPRYDRCCRSLPLDKEKKRVSAGESYVVRLKVPDDQQISFTDMLRGKITFNSSQVDDQVLLKSDGYPTYHLAVVIDDHLMKISHVMRGEEWISSTPKHVLLYQAFGWELPIFAHIPVFLNPDGKGKMSKRKGTVSAQSFLDKGYLPDALLNFFMILGWTSHDQREILSLDEYINEFDPIDVSSNSVVFDLKKLDWLNGVYIRKMAVADLKQVVTPFLPSDFPYEQIDIILPLVVERLVTLSDIEDLTSFFYRKIMVDTELLLKKSNSDEVIFELNESIKKLNTISSWNHQEVEKVIRSLQEENSWKKGQYFMMLRIAVTGKKATPPLFESIAVLGKKKTIERLRAAIDALS